MTRRLLLALSLALAGTALAPAASQAFVGCSHGGGTLSVFMNQSGDTVTIARGGDAINVIAGDVFGEGPSILLTCTGSTATVGNTDRIVIDEAAVAIFTVVELDLAGGPLAPGLTPEADGTSEIELQANMFGLFSFFGIGGTSGDDFIHMGGAASGAAGVNLNAGAEAAPDVDLELTQSEVVIAATRRGNDVLRGRRSPGFAGRLPKLPLLFALGGPGRDEMIAGSSSLLLGGDNNDKLLGSRFTDSFSGGRGRDLIKAGRGNDEVLAARAGRDRVNCGAGAKDSAIVDRKDRAGNCERERRRLPDLEDVVIVGDSTVRRLSRALGNPDLRPEMIDAALDLLNRK